ncbi:hypothetical protein SAMN06265348_102557 [Pedobacter westerhofensis]|uniref:Cyclic nucleotide-binding domain-containing protein n=1 Tax=Pedobacter westerhofensis TaxID=425512 RepID=A0A521BQF4_9SPHI|nr:hypothetical protein [Pedobacter westerhofensis]SMO49377.1 hypothetical protein SAMN06265348_102557 [Pedobacter westerhofensis]
MTDTSLEINLLRQAMAESTGMDAETFDLSLPHWHLKRYKKGEFYNEYKNVCKHLGFIINGVFRIYRANEETGEEKNMLFFSKHGSVKRTVSTPLLPRWRRSAST